MAKVNRLSSDAWTAVHFLCAIAIAVLILFFARNIAHVLIFGTLIVLLWEGFEAWLKKYYDVFNIPFGKGTVLEAGVNISWDIIAGELGLLLIVMLYEIVK